MQEILCMLIGTVIAIFVSFAVPEKYQEKFILGFSLLYVIIYVILKYDLFNIWDMIYYLHLQLEVLLLYCSTYH